MKESKLKKHDNFFRASLSDKAIALDFFKAHLSEEIWNLIKWDTLTLLSKSYIEDSLKESIVDVLYHAKTNNNSREDVYFYLLTEHQSKPQKLMPFRLLKYITRIMDQHLHQHNTEVLPVVYPLVLYNGTKAYPYSTDIFTLFESQITLAQKILLKPFQLIDLNTIPDEELRDHAKAALLEWALKHIYERDILPYIHDIITIIKDLALRKHDKHFAHFVYYIISSMNIPKSEQFVEILVSELPEELGETVMTIAEQLIQKGRMEGREEGREEGQIQIILKMIRSGMQMHIISEITGFSIVQLEKINSQYQH